MANFWDRVREARLFRILLVYLGAAWVILQLTALLREEFLLPRWVTPLAAILLLIGLVIIATTAWIQAHPFTRRKKAELPAAWSLDLGDLKDSVARGRLPHLTWARAILGGVVAFSLLFGFAGLYVLLTGRAPTLPAPKEAVAAAAPGIAVLPFRVVGADLELWREGMVDLLSTNLDGAAGFRSNDPRTLLNSWRGQVGEAADQPDLEVALGIARGVGATYAVMGSAVELGSGVRISANVYEVESGRQVGQAQVEGPTDDVLTLVDELSIQVIQRIFAVSPEELPQFDVRDVTTTSLTALKAYLEGEQKFRRGLWNAAVEDYARAVEADSTFALAIHRLAQAYGWSEAFSPRVIEYARRAARQAHRLPERAAALVRANALLDELRREAVDSLLGVTRRYPDDVEAWFALADAYYHVGSRGLHRSDKYREAFRKTLALDSTYSPVYIHLIEDAIARRDSADTRRYLDSYTRLNPAGDEAVAYSLMYDLAWGDSTARRAASNAVDTLSADALSLAAFNSLGRAASPWDLSFTLTEEQTDERFSAAERAAGYLHLYRVYLSLGRLREAREAAATFNTLSDGSPSPVYARLLARWMAVWGYPPIVEPDDSTVVPGNLTRFIYGAYAADKGRWALADSAIQVFADEAEQAAAEGQESGRLIQGSYAAALTAYLGLRRDGVEAALVEFEKPMPRLPGWTHSLLRFSIGKALLEEGRALEAEKFLRTSEDSFQSLVPALYYLGEAYETIGDRQQAQLHYARFVNWWEEADPELQPWVERARRALERLAGEPAAG